MKRKCMYIIISLILVILSACTPDRETIDVSVGAPHADPKLDIQPIDVPPYVVAISDEVIAFRALGVNGEEDHVILTLEDLQEVWDFNQVIIVETDNEGVVQSRITLQINDEPSVEILATAGNQYLVYADLGVSYQNNYNLLCFTESIVRDEPDVAGDICTKILCSSETFEPSQVNDEFSQLAGQNGWPNFGDGSIGGLPGDSNVCERCARPSGTLSVSPADCLGSKNGDIEFTPEVTPIIGVPPIIIPERISAGSQHTCAVKSLGPVSPGSVKCWGSNSAGQLGDGTNQNHTTPVDVIGLTNGVMSISAGSEYTCALTSAGGVKCWGTNSAGQLGDGTTDNRTTPVDVNGMTSGVIAISAGYEHTCALTNVGGVKCWGSNFAGQLGDGTIDNRTTPMDVSGLTSDVIAISAGTFHTCAVTNKGSVKCWGSNTTGLLGQGNDFSDPGNYTPDIVSGLNGTINIVSAGEQHTCALTSAGGVKCWGGNFSGQLGEGSTTDHHNPVDVSGLANGVIDVSADGFNHTCALTSTGSVKCWGGNSFGQLGDGSTTDHNTPVDVSGLANDVVAVTIGQTYSCALLNNNTIKCWGANEKGQLGDGSTTKRNSPVDVMDF